jgi:hypothetical protein
VVTLDSDTAPEGRNVFINQASAESIGQSLVQTLAASGNIQGKEGETFAADKLGSRTVGKDGVVLLGPPTVFNADNIDKFNF